MGEKFGEKYHYSIDFIHNSQLFIIILVFWAQMTQIMKTMFGNISEQIYKAEQQGHKSSLISKSKQFFKKNNIQYQQEEHDFIALLSSEFFLRSQLKDLGLIGSLKIEFQNQSLLVKFSLLDTNGSSIKARSQHQKTGLSKFLMILNTSLENESFLCNPLTGQIQLRLNFFYTHPLQAEKTLQNILTVLNQNKRNIQKILDFLEYTPPLMNPFLQNISNKMEKCRTMILGEHQNYKPSFEQQQYEQYFLQPHLESPVSHSWLQLTRNRVYLQSLTNNLVCKFIQQFSNDDVKRFNWITVQLTKESQKYLDNFRDERKNLEGITHIVNFKKSGKEQQGVQINFVYKGVQRVNQQKGALQKIAKKDKFYKFIRQYINIKRQSQSKEQKQIYMVYKHENYTKLRQFLGKNKMSISYQTKLHLCFELVSIAYVGLLKLKNFLPSYQSYDLNVTQDHNITVQTVVSYYKNNIASIQVAETCYEVLYGVRCSSHCLKQVDSKIKIKKWFHTIKSVNDGQSRYQGVSIINYWIKKILLDIINNNQYPNRHINTYKKSLIQEESLSFTGKSIEAHEIELQNISNARQVEHFKKILFVMALSYKIYSQTMKSNVQICSMFDFEL